MPPRILLLDVMGTLVHDPFFAEIPEFFGMTVPELVEATHPRAWVDFEYGRIDESAMMSRFFADGRPFDVDGLKEAVTRAYRFLPGIEELLAELVGHNVPMHALSNYPRWYERIEQRLTVSRYVQWTFVSCQTGFRKPDPMAYANAARCLGVEPVDCAFVDDRSGNCQAAREFGMAAVKFETAGTLRSALVELGVFDEKSR